MATRTFLTENEIREAEERLVAPVRPPDGETEKENPFSVLSFCDWLGVRLLSRLEKLEGWSQAEPIALGSWSRGELCPKSDIDLLFVGEESAVRSVMQAAQEEGLKIRSRVPLSLRDWTKGVEPFDILALRSARALTPQAGVLLAEQQEKIFMGHRWAREILKAMRQERDGRNHRYDSIANFLEPNIKYGPGGLRDLEQALAGVALFPGRGLDDSHTQNLFSYYKGFFLTLRSKLHLNGQNEILAATEQHSLAKWFGYSTNTDFMREVQKGLDRVSFYADWVFATAIAAPSRRKKVEQTKLDSPRKLFRALRVDPSVMMQKRVRREAGKVLRQSKITRAQERKLGLEFKYFLLPDTPDAETVALFRSRLVDQLVPDFKRLVGHVQHDQYHRYSADAHLVQAVRELKRIYLKPQTLGRLKPIVKKLSNMDWQILMWSCLYHDLAKGLAGDHSLVGVDIARRDLKRLGVADKIREEVEWMVRSHLWISEAAFRRNPHSPETWRELDARGVEGGRLLRLTIFTALDIRATNPEAWTTWKERLLVDLYNAMESPRALRYLAFSQLAQKSRGLKGAEIIAKLDPFLVESVSPRVLVKDLGELKRRTTSASPLIVRTTSSELWIRFHARHDRPGLFIEFVQALGRAGTSIRHAVAMTDDGVGVYDWFQVKSTKPTPVLEKLLQSAASDSASKSIRFQAIDLVSREETEWVISFRGLDQAGALLSAARALYDLGATIRWAKVHTWGRQIDDVFSIQPLPMSTDEVLGQLRQRLRD